ncbi:MAG: hypothetical protein UX62_C0017G0016 [Microgenomates group bacterium GW2011_GWA2_46_7]|nr:MAG: hypothetical protein UX62_C0017G0016 [Microgenomates group bacterium GW2011_GWA2_46_7]
MSILDQATRVAATSLRACYRSHGIVAGNHHFTDYWARDGYFAALGALTIGDQEIVSKMVKLFFSYQKPSGQLPYRVMNGPMLSLSKYLGHPTYYKAPHPTYHLRGFGQPIFDGTTLSVLFAALLHETQYLPQIKLALKYLESREKHGLLWDGPMAEWNDAVWKWGNLLYSNIIYWYVYDQLARWQSKSNSPWSTLLSTKRDEIADSLRSRLWNGQFFADWHDYKRQDYFYPFGNCLAIAWGLTTKAETASILNECLHLAHDFTLETNSPKYPWWRIDPLHHLAGMGDYQNQHLLWWQPVSSYLAALYQSNQLDTAQLVAKQIQHKITRDQTIYEVYTRDGQPVKRFNYTAEHPFAWASGMILWALAYNKPHAKK